MSEILQLGGHGPLFELHPPHTVESLRADAGRSPADQPWTCRHIGHRWEVVGDVYVPDAHADDMASAYASLFALMASSDTSALVRCERCGTVRKRTRWA